MERLGLTLVTALFDIGREALDDEFKRSYDEYLSKFEELLKVDLPMVIFCDEHTKRFVIARRSLENTRIVNKRLTDLRAQSFFNDIQKIRTSVEWRAQAEWLSRSPQAQLEYYNPVVMSKQFFLNDAAIFNFFNTTHLAWIDAGIANTLSVSRYFGRTMVDKIINAMQHKMCYIAFPYDGRTEVHGFEKRAFNAFSGVDTKIVVRGGFFGGPRAMINEINPIYYTILTNTLNAGVMGTEENLFTIISYTFPEKVKVYTIGSDGLIYKFFEDLYVQEALPEDSRVALYALTYNLPKQFELWAASMNAAYPEYFNLCKKYVLNNSTDQSVDSEYKRLFKLYGFTEFKYDNIGINDARLEIARHFDKSAHRYMVFFEDDMLMHPPGAGSSRLGFPTYCEDLFNRSRAIVEYEELDFLKLNFDEFFGSNLENWGWYNVASDRKPILFPDGDKRTRVSHIGSLYGLPYAVGNYHYCNWPLLFTKPGNRKVFLDTIYEHNYENTWMAAVAAMRHRGELRAGVLLASPIEHRRVYHYKASDRKENAHYKSAAT